MIAACINTYPAGHAHRDRHLHVEHDPRQRRSQPSIGPQLHDHQAARLGRPPRAADHKHPRGQRTGGRQRGKAVACKQV